jgi:hypothetical protein
VIGAEVIWVGVVVVVAVAAVKAVVVVAGEKKDRDGEAVERWRWRGEDEENQERRVDLLRTARKNIVVVLSEGRGFGKSEGLLSSQFSSEAIYFQPHTSRPSSPASHKNGNVTCIN